MKTECTRVVKGLSQLKGPLCTWAEQHLSLPNSIEAIRDPDSTDIVTLIQMTQDTGNRDSSYLVVFDPEADSFGLVMKVADGRTWYLGPIGEFDEAIINM